MNTTLHKTAHKKTIFVVEDEITIQELIRYNLEKEHYAVQCFDSAEAMLSTLATQTPHAFLLDIMLPGISGLDACKEIRSREESAHTPILMLTAKGEESDIVIGLELGADDYMVKPFSPRVLVARLKALLRRSKPPVIAEVSSTKSNKTNTILTIANITMDTGRHEVTLDAQPLVLTSSEFKALHFLGTNRGWVYTRHQIVERVHGENYPVTDRSVDVMIAGLRKKLGATGQMIETIRGIGYRFKEENIA